MNLKSLLHTSIALFSANIIVVLLIISFPSAHPQIFELTDSFTALNYIHKVYNASLHWPTTLYQTANTQLFSVTHITACLASLLSIGLFFVSRILTADQLLKPFLISLMVPLTIYYFWSSDIVLFTILAGSVGLVPITFKALTVQNGERLWILITVLCACVIAMMTGILCLAPIALGLLLGAVLKKELYPDFPIIRVKRDYLVFIIPLTLALSGLAFQAWPNLPDYSPLGHVIEDDGLPGNILPLFAQSPSIPIINRALVKELFSDLAFLQLVLAVFLWLGLGRSWLTNYMLGSVILVWLDIFPSETISLIAPLASIERLLPGLFYFPLSVILLAFNIIMILFAVSRATSGRIAVFATATLIIVVTWLQTPKGEPFTGGLFVPASVHKSEQEYEVLLKNDSSWSNQRKFLISPSYAVLNKTGLWPLTIPEVIKHWQFSSLFKEQPTILASANSEATKSLIDRDINTRWSPGGGRQTGQEWVYLNFRQPFTIHGLELETGPYHTDFARGIQIWSAEVCPNFLSADNPSLSGLTLVADNPVWEGSLVMTTDGYPYFGSQGTGKIYFQSPIKSNCLLIKQTGQTDKFDWSLTQIRVLKYPQ